MNDTASTTTGGVGRDALRARSGGASRPAFPAAPVIALVGAAAAAIVASAAAGLPLVAAATIAAAVPAAVVDLAELRLPNRLVGLAALVGAVTAAATAISSSPVRWSDAALGLAGLAVPLLLAHLVAPASMGFGDVKLAAVLGAAIGTIEPALTLVALALASGGTAVAAVTRRRRTVPFGPGLVAGSAAAIVVHAVTGGAP